MGKISTFVLILRTILATIDFINASSPPLPPSEIHLESTGREFLVTWKEPLAAYGEILSYTINYSILPSLKVYTNIVTRNQTFSVIPFSDHRGQLFIISLQAENDYGLSKQSIPCYIRAGCGEDIEVEQHSTQRLESPSYPHEFQYGVLCIWHLFTNVTHGFSISIKDMAFGKENPNCASNYLLIEANGFKKKLCTNTTTIRVEENDVKILFRSGRLSTDRGFSLDVISVARKPDPPGNITLSSLGKVILVTWSPPTGNHLPITSYKLCYQALPVSSKICLFLLANRSDRFIINTRGHEGQVFAVTMTSKINDIESDTSVTKYYRSSCSWTIYVKSETNITSPGYPSHYPSSIICQWKVRTINKSPLELHMRWTDIQNTTACNSDYIKFTYSSAETICRTSHGNHCEIYQDRICGTSQKSRTLVLREGSVDIIFVSDRDVSGRGFLLQALGHEDLDYTTTTRLVPTKSSLLRPPSVINHQQTPSSNVLPSYNTLKTKILQSYTPQLNMPANVSKSQETPILSTAIDAAFYGSWTLQQLMSTSSPKLVLITPSKMLMTSSIDEFTNHFETTDAFYFSTLITDISTFKTKTAIDMIQETESPDSFNSSPFLISSTDTTQVMSTESMMSTVAQWTDYNVQQITSSNATTEQKPITEQTPTDALNTTYALNVLLTFTFNPLDRCIWANRSTVVEELQKELTPYWNKSRMFQELSLYKWKVLRGIMPIQVKIGYNSLEVLKELKNNRYFSLVEYVNKTTLQNLKDYKDGWPCNMTLDVDSLDKFRKSYNLFHQKITNPCDVVKYTCPDCMVSASATHGVVCLASSFITTLKPGDNHSKANKDSTIFVIVTAVAGGFLAVFSVVMVIRECRKRTNIQHVTETKINNIPVHELFKINQQDVFTSTLSKTLHNKKNRGGSVPCRVLLNKRKTERDLVQNVRHFSTFIEDTDTLTKRLKVKRGHRRVISL